MQELIQDAMIYKRAYSRPDHFIKFMCNPHWDEIKNLLLSGQASIHRQDITACIQTKIKTSDQCDYLSLSIW